MIGARGRCGRVMTRLQAFARAAEGLAAVEFALLLPVLLLLYAGCIELTTAMALDRKTSRAASTLVDLLAQDAPTLLAGTDAVYAAEVTAIFDAVTAIFEPYPTTTAKLLLLVVTIDSPTRQTVVKCTTRNDVCANVGAISPLTVPTSVATSGQAIIGRVQYTYTSPVSSVLMSLTGHDIYNLNHIFYMKPRSG